MNVILSGYNLDRETLKEFENFIRDVTEKLSDSAFPGMNPGQKTQILQSLHQEALQLLERDNLTPETLSAAYARISRNPKPVNELREIARKEVDRARKSNRNIIFGLGHSSVAEHAVFNFDIIGISRLAVEAVEHFRMASYTEKSQRYILFENEFVVPEELEKSSLKADYISLIQHQNKTYHKLYKSLRPYFFQKYSEMAADPKNHGRLEGLAKEDARYVISLATQTQLGMTLNARSLENMISKCAAHPLQEVRDYARLLYRTTQGYAPSLIKYVEPTDYLLKKRNHISTFISNRIEDKKKISLQNEPVVQLLDYPADGDDRVLAAVLFSYGGFSYADALKKIGEMCTAKKTEFFKSIFQNINSWESVLREFEFIYVTFQLTISASSFGQLKRHRMANIVSAVYDPDLGVTIPESIQTTDQSSTFLEIIDKTSRLYHRIYQENPEAASYCLTNAHRRRVLFKINLREFYHFSRLREDKHAQWDIRKTALEMQKLIAQKLPLSAVLLGGKGQFEKIYNNFFHSNTSKFFE